MIELPNESTDCNDYENNSKPLTVENITASDLYAYKNGDIRDNPNDNRYKQVYYNGSWHDVNIFGEEHFESIHIDENNVREKRRYIDALMRHILGYLDDNKSVDKESGLPHLWHACCNMAFLCEMEKDNWPERKEEIIRGFSDIESKKD